MADREQRKQATDHDEPQPSGVQGDIIPGRHGKHGGSPESEGEPQDENREADPPRKADDASSGR